MRVRARCRACHRPIELKWDKPAPDGFGEGVCLVDVGGVTPAQFNGALEMLQRFVGFAERVQQNSKIDVGVDKVRIDRERFFVCGHSFGKS